MTVHLHGYFFSAHIIMVSILKIIWTVMKIIFYMVEVIDIIKNKSREWKVGPILSGACATQAKKHKVQIRGGATSNCPPISC